MSSWTDKILYIICHLHLVYWLHTFVMMLTQLFLLFVSWTKLDLATSLIEETIMKISGIVAVATCLFQCPFSDMPEDLWTSLKAVKNDTDILTYLELQSEHMYDSIMMDLSSILHLGILKFKENSINGCLAILCQQFKHLNHQTFEQITYKHFKQYCCIWSEKYARVLSLLWWIWDVRAKIYLCLMGKR